MVTTKIGNVAESFPFSAQQRRIWLHASGSPAFCVQAAVLLDGAIQFDSLQDRIRNLVREEPALRTVFQTGDGSGPEQAILDFLEPAWAIAELINCGEAELSGLLASQRDPYFDLQHGPIFRIMLAMLPDDHFVLVLTLPAICADSLTLQVLLQRISGASAPIPASSNETHTYLEFAAWEQEVAGTQGKESLLGRSFWNRQNITGASIPALPGFHRNSSRTRAVEALGSRSWIANVGSDLALSLHKAGQDLNVHTGDLLRAAWVALIGRLAPAWDHILGEVVNGRKYEEIGKAAGPYARCLPLRAQFKREQGVDVLARELQKMRDSAVDWQEYAAFSDELIFPVQFECNDWPAGMDVLGVPAEFLGQYSRNEKFLIKLSVASLPDTLQLAIAWDDSQLDSERMGTLGERFLRLLGSAAADPSQRLTSLPVMTRGEEEAILTDFNDTHRASTKTGGIHTIVEGHAIDAPARTAVVFSDHSLSYAELNARANQVAHQLLALHLKMEQPVGILLERSEKTVIALLGILKAGGAYVILDLASPRERIQKQIEDARIDMVVTEASTADSLEIASGTRTVPIEEATRFSPANPDLQINVGQLAYVLFTSGSTGRPKGVQIEHRQLIHYVLAVQSRMNLGSGSSFAIMSTFAADLGNTMIFGALCSGGSLHVIPADTASDPELLRRYLRSHKIDCMKIVPSHISALLSAEKPEELLPQKLLVLGGEAATWTLIEEVREASPHLRILNHYGPTETTVGVLTHEIALDHPAPESATVPIGSPLPNCRVYLLDDELRPVPPGVRGEVFIGGDGLGRGYMGHPDVTAEKFIPDPFRREGGRLYRTGDIGVLTSEHLIEFLGRSDDQIKIHGYRIELGEIEQVLREHPAVSQVVLLAREKSITEKQLAAYVVPKQDAKVSPEDLHSYVTSRLPSYMTPATITILKSMPLNANGKIDRGALLNLQSGHSREASAVAPRTSQEKMLAEIFRDVLGIPLPGVFDNFFELGGDSILAIQVVAKANRQGFALSPRQIFESQTIAELAASSAASLRTLNQEPVTGHTALSPIQRWFFEQQFTAMNHWNQSFVLEVDKKLSASLLEIAIQALIAHHDVLRSQFLQIEGNWAQQITGVAEYPNCFLHIDLSHLSGAALEKAREEHVATVQASVDLARGPVLRFVLFDHGPALPRWLLISCHHLVMDGVSWRILLEDLQIACEQLLKNEPVALSFKTISWQEWTAKLCQCAESESLFHEAQYWSRLADCQVRALPRDSNGPNTFGSGDTVLTTFEEETTRILLQKLPERYGTQINEVLLTALARTFAGFTRSSELLVDLEGHGREDISPGLDTSRTVGWFTTHYPVLLETDIHETGMESLKRIAAQVHAVPGKGIGYGLVAYVRAQDALTKKLRNISAREVKFNYLGQTDSLRSSGGLFSVLAADAGSQRDEFSMRTHLIDLNAIVIAGKLHVRWTYSRNIHRRSTIQALAQAFVKELNNLVDGNTSSTANCYSPADFPLARLDDSGLQDILQLLADKSNATDDGRQAQEIEDIYPLSALQESLLAHCLSAPGSAAGFEQKSIRLSGDLDLQAFQRTWQEIVDQHAIFRTLFLANRQGRFLQVVLQRAGVPIDFQDWRDTNAEDQAAKLKTWLESDRARGFNPGIAPLMRLALIQMDGNSYELVWSYHHLLLDAWCRNLVLRDVFTLYEAFRQKKPAQLARSRPYRDYIEWLGKQDEAAAERFWRGQLGGVRYPTTLLGCAKLDRSPATERDFHVHTISLSEEESIALQSFAKKQRLTVNTLLQGAWSLVLSQLSGTCDVVYGTTTSGRPTALPGAESILGMFINNLPVRVRVSGAERVSTWLAGLQRLLLQVREYEWVSPQKFREWSGLLGGQRLFESLLIAQNYPVDDGAASQPRPELEIRQTYSRLETNYPITLVAGPFNPLTIRIFYDSRSLPQSTVARWGESILAVLRGFSRASDAFVRDIPLLTPAQEELIRELSGPHGKQEEIIPCPAEGIAVVEEGQQITWGRLYAQSWSVAEALRKAGARTGETVALFAVSGIDMAVAVLGIWNAGCIVVVCDGGNRKKAESCLQRTGTRYALVCGSAPFSLGTWDGTVVQMQLGATEAVPDAKKLASAPGDTLAWLQPVANRDEWMAISHAALAQRAAHLRKSLSPVERRRLMIAGPVETASLELAEALMANICAAFVPWKTNEPYQRLRQALEESQVTAMRAPAHVWRALIESGWQKQPDFTAVCSSPVVTRWLERELSSRVNACFKAYAVDNVSFWLASAPMSNSSAPADLGSSWGNVGIFILSEGLHLLPAGIYGEIYLRIPCHDWGYWNSPQATAEDFLPDPFSDQPGMRLYRTGHIGRWNEDGRLEFGGMAKKEHSAIAESVMNLAAESALSHHPELREVAVRKWKDSNAEEQMVVYFAAERKALPGVESLSELVRGRLPRHCIPQLFVRMERLPRDRDGSCNPELLPPPDQVETRVEHAYVPPSDPITLQIKQIWEDLFHIRPLGVREHFFDLGGHSLLAVRLMNEISRRLNRRLPVSLLLQSGNIESLARVIRRQSGPIAWSPLVQLRAGSESPPLFCIHPMGGEVFCYLDLAHYLGLDQAIYGLQARGWGGEGEQEATVEEMAAAYLRAMRERQPKGPYFLTGWSFGGLVALEIAQQLLAAGESTPLLAVLDTNMALHLDGQATNLPDRSFMDWPRIILRFARPGAEIQEEELRRFDHVEDQIAHAIERGVLPPGLTAEDAMCYVRSSSSNTRAKNSYLARPYPGRVTLFRARQGHVLRCPDPTLGWQRIAQGGLKIIDVPGEHDVMLEMPHVGELARQLREFLSRARESSASATS